MLCPSPFHPLTFPSPSRLLLILVTLFLIVRLSISVLPPRVSAIYFLPWSSSRYKLAPLAAETTECRRFMTATCPDLLKRPRSAHDSIFGGALARLFAFPLFLFRPSAVSRISITLTENLFCGERNIPKIIRRYARFRSTSYSDNGHGCYIHIWTVNVRF